MRHARSEDYIADRAADRHSNGFIRRPILYMAAYHPKESCKFMKEKVLLSWSGGKDSALALYEVQKDSNYEIAALLTTVTEDYKRVSMHGIRSALLEQQAESLGYPLENIFISKEASQEKYDAAMLDILTKYKTASEYCYL